ncbi:hypothetical protein AAGS40_19715 [Paraburkholderia sp. PREW-6R]|uniref:hypothetical protein n=1 Tax=Paraburkholderia sp. PREW-6R TaxID=3141544 RepID=UPI0031F593F2
MRAVRTAATTAAAAGAQHIASAERGQAFKELTSSNHGIESSAGKRPGKIKRMEIARPHIDLFREHAVLFGNPYNEVYFGAANPLMGKACLASNYPVAQNGSPAVSRAIHRQSRSPNPLTFRSAYPANSIALFTQPEDSAPRLLID